MNGDQVSRLKKIIETDRLGLTGEASGIIVRDIERVLADYFELSGEVKIKFDMQDKGFLVTVTCEADGFKGFSQV